MVREIRDDAQDLPEEGVQPLRVEALAAARITGTAVAAGDVQHAPVGIAGPGSRIERNVAERVDPAVQWNAQQLAGAALERRVRDVRVRPFDEHAFVVGRSRRRDRRRGRVAGDIETGDALIVRRQPPRQRDLLEMNGVEAPVARVLGIDLEADEAARQAGVRRELVEQAGAGPAAVEVEIGRGALRARIDDVEGVP